QAEVVVAPPAAARSLGWTALRNLLLAAEILSPSSQRADRFTKRRLYQERSVPTCLVVDGDARQVAVWTPEAECPVRERERLMWLPTGAERTFTLELNELFRAI